MKKQEIFETVCKHLFKQGKQAVDEGGSCQYRAPNGTMCAVGCLMDDKTYKLLMEGHALDELLDGGTRYDISTNKYIPTPGFKVPGYFKRNRALLEELQGIHDNAVTFYEHDLRESLRDVGRRHDCRIGFLGDLKLNV